MSDAQPGSCQNIGDRDEESNPVPTPVAGRTFAASNKDGLLD